MRFKALIKTGVSILLLSGICLPEEEAFLSLNGDCRYPAVAAERNNVFLALLVAQVRPAALYFQKSMDEGRTWGRIRRISNENADCLPPSIAVDSGIVHLAWIDCGSSIDGELYYARSIDSGETWEERRILVGNVNSAQIPLIACGENNVYLIWQDVETKVFFKASRDRGRSWGNETLLGEVGKHSCYCFPPGFSVIGNELTVVWSDFREKKKGFNLRLFGIHLLKNHKKQNISSIICRKSPDNGRTWRKKRILSMSTVAKEMKGKIDNPALFSDGMRLYFLWVDKCKLPLGEILYGKFDPAEDNGPLTGKVLYPAPKRSPKCPSAAFDRDRNLHCAWTSSFGGESIVHYGAIDTAGNAFNNKKDLTSNAGHYQNPVITRTPSGLLHIFWFNKSVEKDERAKIFLKTSADNGRTWKNRGSQTTAVRN